MGTIHCHFCNKPFHSGARKICDECRLYKTTDPQTATASIKAAYIFAVENDECSNTCDQIASLLRPFAGLAKKRGPGYKTAQEHRQEWLDTTRLSWARTYGTGDRDGTDAGAWRFLARQFGEAEARRLLPEFVPDPDLDFTGVFA